MNDGRHDFDFLVGTWNVHNRRLKERLVGCEEWEAFEGVAVVRNVLGGIGQIDELTVQRESGEMHGLTLRLFDPETAEWSLHWSDSVAGRLAPPMIGKFDNDRGEFYAHETHNKKHIFNRFIWTVINPDVCRWEQAFSDDGGTTWETNWTMEITRRA